MKNIRLLPVLLAVSILSFVVRVADVAYGFRSMSGSAIAEEKKADDKSSPASGKKTDDSSKDTKDPQKDAAADKAAEDKMGDDAQSKDSEDAKKGDGKNGWPDPSDMDPDLANVRAGLAKDLTARRQYLDDREKLLVTREALLKAAEAELDQKYQEMKTLRGELQNLLHQQSEEEVARMKSLVRIYEGMKPGDAARIFNTLDLTILLEVMTRMSERKSAPILAAMDPERARVVTLMMAQQKKLPDVPDIGGAPSTNPAGTPPPQ